MPDGFLGAAVALVVGEVVALALLLVVGATGDEVDRGAPVADLVDRREGLRRECWVGNVGPVREQLDLLGLAGDIRRRRARVGRARAVGGPDAVPSVILVRPREPQRVVLSKLAL